MKVPLLGLAFAISASSCADSTIGEGSALAPAAPVRQSSSIVGSDPAAALVQALAGAMQDPAARAAILNAMRRSDKVAHALFLDEFIASSSSAPLRAAMRRSAPELDVQASLRQLPRMEFSMPMRDHRRSWRGDARVVVAGHSGRGTPIIAYDTRGDIVDIQSLGRAELPPLLVVRPAEWLGRRVNRQRDVPGNVIQDAGDGEQALVYVWHGRDGDSVTIDMADEGAAERLAAQIQRVRANAEGSVQRTATSPAAHVQRDGNQDVGSMELSCPPEAIVCDEPPPPPPPPPSGPPTTLLRHEQYFCDDNGWACWLDDLELRFETRNLAANGTDLGGYWELRFGGVPGGQDATDERFQIANRVLSYRAPSPPIFTGVINTLGSVLRITLVEEDHHDPLGWNNDDGCGSTEYTWQQRGAMHPISNLSGLPSACRYPNGHALSFQTISGVVEVTW